MTTERSTRRSNSRLAWFFVFLAALALIATAHLRAQGDSGIVGNVVDPTAAGVVGAAISATEENTGVKYSTTTGVEGSFLFPSLPVGTYDVSVAAKGFQGYEQKEIRLQVGERQSLQIQLTVGVVTDSVTVTAVAAQVNSSNAELGTVIDQQRIEDLPLNGRDPLQLMTLAAGAVPASAARVKQAFTYANTFVSSDGGRTNSVGFVLEGGDNTDKFTRVAQPFPNPDALEEFQFKTNDYSAEYGQANGGIVDAVIRSGSNQIHGSAFEYVRNYDLNATNFFSPGQPDGLKRNQFGFTLGGPVIFPKLYNGKDKTFFFASFQDTRLSETPSNSFTFSPTQAERNGDFSALGTTVIDPTTGAPFQGNQIPLSRFSAPAIALLKYVPLPAAGTDLLQFQTAQKLDEFQWVGKLDQAISDREKLTASILYTNQNNIPSFEQNDIFSATQGIDIVVPTANLNLTSTIRPNLLNVLHASYSRQDSLYRGPTGPDLSTLGVQQPNLDPNTLGSVQVNNFFTAFNADFPERVVQNTVQLYESVSWIKGKHEFKFGAEYTQRQTTTYSTYNSSGQFTFGGEFSGSNLTDYFLGLPSKYQLSAPDTADERYHTPSFYALDNFRASRKLTINLGLRYDPFFAPSDYYHNQGLLWSPGSQSTRFPNAPADVLFPGDPGVNGIGLNNDLHTFAPRVGLAFDPTGSGKFAIRAGYGWFFEPQDGNIDEALTGQQPFVNQVVITPPQSFSNPFAGQPAFNPNAFGTFSLPAFFNGFSKNNVNGLVQQWNFTLEKQLPGSVLIRAGYVGAKGTHLQIINDVNPGIYEPGATEANLNQRRPYGTNFSDIIIMQSEGNSTYHALQITVEKRWSHSFSVLSNYTWGKSIDDTTIMAGLGNPPIYDPFNNHGAKGLSDFDVPQRFVTSGLWALPTLAGSPTLLREIAGGWQINGIGTVSSGLPFTVTSGVDNSFSGLGEDHADQVQVDAGLPSGRPIGQKLLEWFNTSAFTTNAIGTFGNAGRNILRGPGLFDIDASLFKNFPIKESLNLQFRAEFFNILNHPNFPVPNSDVSSPQFGQILPTGTNLSSGQVSGSFDPRIIQLALKLRW